VSTKGRIRELNRKGSRADQSPAAAEVNRRLADPTVCERCGALYTRKKWRKGLRVSQVLLAQASWTVCAACAQVASGAYFGRVLLEGGYVLPNQEPIRLRIANIAARAEFTQPERRVVDIGRQGAALEVLTTSQKLAHRIAAELKKTFKGRVSYHWSDQDGSLFATWRRD
jgi:NMD protein affecting ribosome stability and mRNA decay